MQPAERRRQQPALGGGAGRSMAIALGLHSTWVLGVRARRLNPKLVRWAIVGHDSRLAGAGCLRPRRGSASRRPRNGQGDDERGAPAVRVGGAHAPAVRADDRGDDREAEAGAALPALAAALGAPEALEQRVGVVRRQAGTVVAHLEADVPAVRGEDDLDRARGGRVHERVAQQVGEHLAQLVGVAEHHRRAVAGHRDRAVGGRGAGVVGGVARELREVDLDVRRVRDLVEARERQQVLDEHAHACRLVLDPAHRLLDVGGRAGRAHPEQLRIAADRRQRGPQLVRRVGDELAQPVLARLALGERVLEAVEHGVEREPDAADLGARVRAGDAMREVAARDPARRVPDAVERQQPDAHEDPRDRGEQQQHARDHEALDDEETVEPLVDVPQGDRQDGDPAVPLARRDDAVAGRIAAAPAHGLRLADGELRGDRGLRRQVLPGVEDDRVHRAVRVAQLAVGPGRQADARPAAVRWTAAARPVVGLAGFADALLGQRALDGAGAGARHVVDAAELVGALLGVGDGGEQHQTDRGHDEHGGEQPRAQGEHHVRGVRSA